MLRSIRVRVVAPVALLALTLGMPSAALAATAPAPSPNTTATVPAETASPSATPTAEPTPEASESATQTPAPTATPSASENTETTEPSTAPAPSAATEDGKTVPFVGRGSTARLPGTSSEHAAFAGGYMTRTLAAQNDFYTWPGTDFLDGGNTIDAILGLAGAKVGETQGAASLAHLAKNVDTYVGAGTETYAGPLGKLILGVEAAGENPKSFGGQDLVTRLEGLLTESGRFSDKSAYPDGDYSNTVGQALDLIALGRTTGEAPASAVKFLQSQQCADGGFRGIMAPAGGDCASDLDASAFAAQALVGFGDEETAQKSLDFLATKQQSSGGFINGDGQVNTNSTAVAAQAFATAGRTAELTKAQAYLSDLQLDCSFDAAIRGGIAFTAEDKAALKKAPNDQNTIDRMLRATPQTTLALASGSLLDVTVDGSSATAPSPTCSTGTSTPSPSGSTSTPPGTTSPTGTSGPTTGAPTGTPDTTPPSAGGPGLAYTGGSPIAPLALAALLLLAGAAAVLVARRRGVHQ